MSAELHLHPDGLRRVAHTARRIVDRLDAASAPLPSAAGDAVERDQADVRQAVLRIRDELLGLADAAVASAAGAEEADRAAADRFRRCDTFSTALAAPDGTRASGPVPRREPR
ncbi:hypothetical protein [Pseudonocardia sediminis]|nr:hypothetical protein [Pseudonocardia sediminis]